MRVVTSAHRVRYTYAQYLALESASNVKHEYLDGQIYGMAGGTPQHAALAAAVVGLLFPALRDRGCRAHSADLRVRVRATGLATYPDVTVVCGPRECDPDDDDAVNNPTMIVEVLSPSTEEYDRGEKFDHYKRIESLREYVLIAQDRREVEVWTRGADGSWGHRRFGDGDAAALDSVGAVLDVAALYGAVA
jgi:Uma2 family endonuclease